MSQSIVSRLSESIEAQPARTLGRVSVDLSNDQPEPMLWSEPFPSRRW